MHSKNRSMFTQHLIARKFIVTTITINGAYFQFKAEETEIMNMSTTTTTKNDTINPWLLKYCFRTLKYNCSRSPGSPRFQFISMNVCTHRITRRLYKIGWYEGLLCNHMGANARSIYKNIYIYKHSGLNLFEYVGIQRRFLWKQDCLVDSWLVQLWLAESDSWRHMYDRGVKDGVE